MAAISKNLYFNVLDDIVDKYKNTVHRTIKMKPIDVTPDSYADYNEDSHEKDPKFNVGDRVRISKYKNIFAKGTLKIGQTKFLFWLKLKIQFRGHMWLVTLMVIQLLEVFTKKNCKKLIKKNLEQRKCSKEKVLNCMSNGKVMILVLIVGLMKKNLYKNESILSEAV